MYKKLMVAILMLIGMSMIGCSNKINKEDVDNQVNIIKECFDESHEVMNNINGYLDNDGSDLIGQTDNVDKIEEKLKDVSIDDIENIYINEDDFKKIKFDYLFTQRRIACEKEILKMYDDDNSFSEDEFSKALNLINASNTVGEITEKIEEIQNKIDSEYGLDSKEINKLGSEL